MTENPGEISVKKLIVLAVLTVVLIFLILSQFMSKPKAKSQRGSASTQAGLSTKRPPLPPNFDKLPPKLQEILRKRSQRTS
jgi:hypothetical protein